MSLAHRPYLYVASSWRNTHYPQVVRLLRGFGANAGLPGPHYGVHDFRDPAEGGFSWRDVEPGWEDWSRDRYRALLTGHPLADRGFERDMAALRRATAVLLVGPCGRSAHLELGWAAGAGKATAIYLPEDQEPELMYLLAGCILTKPSELVEWASQTFNLGGKVAP